MKIFWYNIDVYFILPYSVKIDQIYLKVLAVNSSIP